MMLNEYIKREDVLLLAREYYTPALRESAVPVKAIKNIPAEDVVPVRRGKWVREEYDGVFTFNYCSNCKMRLPFSMEWTPNYCPHCGAKMGVGND